MAPADRQLIMETNKALRNIKNELETLLEKNVIDEATFDKIHASLPEESPRAGPLRTMPPNLHASSVASPAPSHNGGIASPPTEAFNNLSVQGQQSARHSPAPPSYEDTPPPGPPPRSSKPVIANARALYRYQGAEARDLALEKDDPIAVHSYINNDWWMGANMRTGAEGIFPRNYVFVESENKNPMSPPPGNVQLWPPPQQQQQYGYPGQQGGPPEKQNPYDSNVPPMAVAEGSGEQHKQGHGKAGEYGKKFGKKLGNAAIFGAGATIGGDIVNSIF